MTDRAVFGSATPRIAINPLPPAGLQRRQHSATDTPTASKPRKDSSSLDEAVVTGQSVNFAHPDMGLPQPVQLQGLWH